MRPIRIHTIGFTGKNAEQFFEKLRKAGVRRVVDVRLHNTSQLAGFAKRDDLTYFLREILKAGYVHLPELAPTPDLLNAYKRHNGTWVDYEKTFLALMKSRQIEKTMRRDVLHKSCLLCSEHLPEHCHRRLVAEYLQEHWDGVEIVHLA